MINFIMAIVGLFLIFFIMAVGQGNEMSVVDFFLGLGTGITFVAVLNMFDCSR